MKVEYVNPFLASTVNTFQTMMQVKVTPGDLVLKKQPFPTYDVSGIIGISGGAAGTISISFPRLTALKVVSKFIGQEIKIVGDEVTDAVGELANIITGSAKRDLSGLNISISLPSVIIGRSHKLSGPSDAQNLVVPFKSELGDFAVEISLKTN
jgi:chemotaxis protein CheX